MEEGKVLRITYIISIIFHIGILYLFGIASLKPIEQLYHIEVFPKVEFVKAEEIRIPQVPRPKVEKPKITVKKTAIFPTKKRGTKAPLATPVYSKKIILKPKSEAPKEGSLEVPAREAKKGYVSPVDVKGKGEVKSPKIGEVSIPGEGKGPYPGDTGAPGIESRVAPVYPKNASHRDLRGDVVIRVLVLSSGNIGKAEVAKSSGYSILDESALRAVRKWKFKPRIKEGRPVDEWISVTVSFPPE
jgi:protein TonB